MPLVPLLHVVNSSTSGKLQKGHVDTSTEKSVTQFMATKERAEEMLRQSEEQRREAKADQLKSNRLNEQISQFREDREQAKGSAFKTQQNR